MKNFLIITIASLLPLFSLASIRDVGNGGDAMAIEFKGIAKGIVYDIKTDLAFLFPEFTVEALQAAIEETEVVSKAVTKLKGVEKDAINYPNKKRIEINRKRWSEHFLKPDRVRALVLHEYLGILKISDADYKISGRLLDYDDSSKQRIAKDEIVGRIALMDQFSYSISRLILFYDGKAEYSATFEGTERACQGIYQWSVPTQILQVDLKCGDLKSELSVNFSQVDAIDFLRGGLVSVTMSYRETTPAGQVNFDFTKPVDAKRLR